MKDNNTLIYVISPFYESRRSHKLQVLSFEEIRQNYFKRFGIKSIISLMDYGYCNDECLGMDFPKREVSGYSYLNLSKEFKDIKPQGPSQLQIKRAFEESFFNLFYEEVRQMPGPVCILIQSSHTYQFSDSKKLFATELLRLSSYIYDYVTDIDLKLVKHNVYRGIRVIDNNDLYEFARGNTLGFEQLVLQNEDYLKKLLD